MVIYTSYSLFLISYYAKSKTKCKLKDKDPPWYESIISLDVFDLFSLNFTLIESTFWPSIQSADHYSFLVDFVRYLNLQQQKHHFYHAKPTDNLDWSDSYDRCLRETNLPPCKVWFGLIFALTKLYPNQWLNLSMIFLDLIHFCSGLLYFLVFLPRKS